MHKIMMAIAAVSACGLLMVGCGPSNQAKPQTAADVQESEPQVDCDAFMQQLAEGCFAVTVFEEDGVTPIHILDEAGNDLGEVDQEWAAGYCECYAQLAFQTFGCSGVLKHEELNDADYATTYEPIVATCATELAPGEEPPAQSSSDAESQPSETSAEAPAEAAAE